MINTNFWSDDSVQDLKPLEKYLFLYFLTNEHTNIAGIYELSIKTICFETDMKKDEVSKAMHRLSTFILYLDGWIVIKNFIKNQALNPKIRTGIERVVKTLPTRITDIVKIDYDSLCIDYDNSNLNSNLNSNPNIESEDKSSIAQPHIRVVNMLAIVKKEKFAKKEEYNHFLKRNIKVASELVKIYEIEVIAKAFIFVVAKEFPSWGLEAVSKNIQVAKNMVITKSITKTNIESLLQKSLTYSPC